MVLSTQNKLHFFDFNQVLTKVHCLKAEKRSGGKLKVGRLVNLNGWQTS